MNDGLDDSDPNVSYKFTLDDGRVVEFNVDRSRQWNDAIDQQEHAPWTRLDFHQCSNCPLTSSDCRHCPAAVDLEPVAAAFTDIVSHEKVKVEVRTEERVYLKDCDAQTGLRSLTGLLMSTSGCPVLQQLRVLAEMHLPFATLNETVFRICGAYLIREYLEMKSGRTPDWDMTKLLRYFEELQTLNQEFKSRLNSAVHRDSNLNALGSLFFISMGLQLSVEENLQEFRKYFQGLGDAPEGV
jgi:hypothetical protein